MNINGALLRGGDPSVMASLNALLSIKFETQLHIQAVVQHCPLVGGNATLSTSHRYLTIRLTTLKFVRI
jgi:hypothetical protein